MKSEDNVKAEILARPPPGQLLRGLHRDPARFLVFGYTMDTFAADFCSLALLYYKKINNRFSPSHASDRGMAQHYLLATQTNSFP